MFKKALLFVTLLLSVTNFSGCIFLVAGAAGAGTAKWFSDKVAQDVKSPLDKVIQSTHASLADMKADIYKETNAPDVTQILAKNADGKQIWVDLRPVDKNTTNIGVRVGYMNGDSDARKILDRIVSKSNSWL